MLSPRDLKDLFGENSPDKVIARAQKLSAKGRNDQAIEVVKEAVGRLGENLELRLEMASLCLSSGRPREAAEALRALLRKEPAHVSRVEEYIGWARTQFSDVEPLFDPLAEGYVARRNYRAAIECLERIQKPTLQGLLDARMNNLNRFLEKGTLVPKSALPTLYFAALAYEAIDDWQRALDSYRKILAASPPEFPHVDERLKSLVGRRYKLASLRLAYAEVLDAAGQRERAWDEYLKALEVDPRCAPQVRRHVETLLESSPGNPDLLWSLVRVVMAEGKHDEALELCGRLAAQQSHLADVEKLLEELTGAGKESVETQLLMARIGVSQGKVSRALSAVNAALAGDAGSRGIEVLEQIVAAFPQEARPYQILADHHLKEGHVERSLEILRKLRSVDPTTSPAIGTRLQAILAADPSNQPARDLLEEVCVEAGDAQGAVPFLRARLRRGPEAARETLGRLRALMLASPGDRGVKLAAAEATYAAGETAAAWRHVQDLIEPGQPPDPEALRLIDLCAGESPEMFSTISSYLTGSVPRWADNPEALFALAEAAGRAGLFRESVDRYRKAAALAPEGATICHAAIRALAQGARTPGAGEEAAALAEALLDVGDLAAATDLLRGVRSLQPGTASRLVDRFGAALRADPKNLSLSAGLAEVCLAAGQMARALEICRVGLAGREDASSAPLMLIYGDALARSGKPAEAARAYATAARRDGSLSKEIIERLQQVIQIDMGLESAHLTLGRLLINDGRVAEGVSALRTAASIKSDLAATVLQDLQRTARRLPGDANVDFAMAELHLAAGDPAAAAEDLGRQVGLTPDRTADLVARLEEIAARHPSCARVHLELGRAYVQKRWAARACACLVRAHELDRSLSEAVALPLSAIQRDHPDVPEGHVARGVLYEAEGRILPAAEAYARAAALGGTGVAGALAGLRRLCGATGTAPGQVFLLYARTCRQLGEINEAVEAAARALSGSTDSAAEVRAELDHLISKNPFHAGARLGRAEAALHAGDHDAAARDLIEALRFERGSAPRVAQLAREILSRHPAAPAPSRVLAEALLISGDRKAAAIALDAALESPEGRADVDLILERRGLALEAADEALAARLLRQAEKAAPDRDRLLDRLHRNALSSQKKRAASAVSAGRLALARGDYFAACELLANEGDPLGRAWALERSGRPIEAAACLAGSLGDAAAASRYAELHDRLVGLELMKRATALQAETMLDFESLMSGEETASHAEQAGEAAEGGAG